MMNQTDRLILQLLPALMTLLSDESRRIKDFMTFYQLSNVFWTLPVTNQDESNTSP